ncbi:NADPH-dependent FMN reductase [Streptomyces sp. 6N223]|uniref:NADPH-dependent FMN reductase n=1 Tax=Streptomyces sp. 6N223 TaxID=3457412 RepID=UPI003FCFA0D1
MPTPTPTHSNAERLTIAVITGSVREGRLGPTVSRWFAEQAAAYAADTATVDLVDLAAVPLPLTMPGSDAALADVSPRLAAADAIVVVTPEYNHSFPASLKNFIDWHNHEWHAKPVGFVSYGGLSGGVRAVEHLRAVFAELHAVTVRATVAFPDCWRQFDADGQPVNAEASALAAKSLLDQLIWWGSALRAARTANPYVG